MDEMKKLSKKSKWYISQNRYLELKNFCLQYFEWKEEINKVNLLRRAEITERVQRSGYSDPTANYVIEVQWYVKKIDTVDTVLSQIDEAYRPYIFEAVTKDLSWNVMRARGLPFKRAEWYDEKRKFFYLLDRQQYSQAFL